MPPENALQVGNVRADFDDVGAAGDEPADSGRDLRFVAAGDDDDIVLRRASDHATDGLGFEGSAEEPDGHDDAVGVAQRLGAGNNSPCNFLVVRYLIREKPEF